MLLAIVAHSNQLAAAVCLRRQASRCRPTRNPANQAGLEISSLLDPRKIWRWRSSGGSGAAEGGLSGGICAQQGLEPADEASGSGAPRCGSGAAFRAEQRAGKSRSKRADAVRIRRAAPCACRRNPGRAAPGSSVADTNEVPLSVRGSLLSPPAAEQSTHSLTGGFLAQQSSALSTACTFTSVHVDLHAQRSMQY